MLCQPRPHARTPCPDTCLGRPVRHGDFVARSESEVPLARPRGAAPGAGSPVTLGRYFWAAGGGPGVPCAASPCAPAPPRPAVCPSAAGPLARARGLLLGFEPVASWEPVTLSLGPFQFSLFRKKFHPGSLQWLPRIRRTPGRLGYRTALKAVLRNLKRGDFSLSYFKLHSSLPS